MNVQIFQPNIIRFSGAKDIIDIYKDLGEAGRIMSIKRESQGYTGKFILRIDEEQPPELYTILQVLVDAGEAEFE